jgi:hypothetical protein
VPEPAVDLFKFVVLRSAGEPECAPGQLGCIYDNRIGQLESLKSHNAADDALAFAKSAAATVAHQAVLEALPKVHRPSDVRSLNLEIARRFTTAGLVGGVGDGRVAKLRGAFRESKELTPSELLKRLAASFADEPFTLVEYAFANLDGYYLELDLGDVFDRLYRGLISLRVNADPLDSVLRDIRMLHVVQRLVLGLLSSDVQKLGKIKPNAVGGPASLYPPADLAPIRTALDLATALSATPIVSPVISGPRRPATGRVASPQRRRRREALLHIASTPR